MFSLWSTCSDCWRAANVPLCHTARPGVSLHIVPAKWVRDAIELSSSISRITSPRVRQSSRALHKLRVRKATRTAASCSLSRSTQQSTLSGKTSAWEDAPGQRAHSILSMTFMKLRALRPRYRDCSKATRHVARRALSSPSLGSPGNMTHSSNTIHNLAAIETHKEGKADAALCVSQATLVLKSDSALRQAGGQ